MRYLIGIGLWVLWLVLLVLKLTGLVDLPWLAVWAPLWGPAVFALVGSALALLWVLGGILLRTASQGRGRTSGSDDATNARAAAQGPLTARETGPAWPPLDDTQYKWRP